MTKLKKSHFSTEFSTLYRREFFISDSRKIVISDETMYGKEWLQIRIWQKSSTENWFPLQSKGILIPSENVAETLQVANELAIEAGFLNRIDNSTLQSDNINGTSS